MRARARYMCARALQVRFSPLLRAAICEHGGAPISRLPPLNLDPTFGAPISRLPPLHLHRKSAASADGAKTWAQDNERTLKFTNLRPNKLQAIL